MQAFLPLPGASAAACIGAGLIGVMLLAGLDGSGMVRVPLVALSMHSAILMLAAAPMVEEFAFRGAVHEGFAALLRRRSRPDAPAFISGSNLATSLVFAACHLPYQPAPLACAIVLPSLVLGRVREATGRVWPCVLLHAWFNACFLAWFGR